MLKELNRITAGLLGLHGYPTQPWTPPAQDPAQDPARGRDNKAAAGGSGNSRTHRRVSRPRRPGLATRA